MKVTLSVIKADIGGYVGHSTSHPEVLAKAEECLQAAKRVGLLVDYHVTNCGDDVQLIMTHQKSEDSQPVHNFAWDTFVEGTKVAKKLKLHGAGQDLLSDAFSGNGKAVGPGVAKMEVEERQPEMAPILMADITSAAASNMPLYQILADPSSTTVPVVAQDVHHAPSSIQYPCSFVSRYYVGDVAFSEGHSHGDYLTSSDFSVPFSVPEFDSIPRSTQDIPERRTSTLASMHSRAAPSASSLAESNPPAGRNEAILRIGRIVELRIPQWVGKSPICSAVCFLIRCFAIDCLLMPFACMLVLLKS